MPGAWFRSTRSVAAVLLAAGLVAVSAQSGVRGVWRATPAAIDGLAGDWAELQPIERGPDVGAMNDAEFLYLVVAARDARLLPPFATGLIVWLDPERGRSRKFGIRLPGVLQPLLPGMDPATAPPASGAYSTRVLDRFDVLGPGDGQRRLVDLTPDLAIELASGYSEKEIVYELKIPLDKTAARLFAVGAPAGGTIGLGIGTPESPRDGPRQRLVGSDGFIGGHPFFGGGFASFREPDGRVKPVEVWTTLLLGTRPS
jgi:hypothetical protein